MFNLGIVFYATALLALACVCSSKTCLRPSHDEEDINERLLPTATVVQSSFESEVPVAVVLEAPSIH